jgi:2,3-bisphosphoglycerate-independent phosphoglycerate mutase
MQIARFRLPHLRNAKEQTNEQTNKQTSRQINKLTNKQTNKQTDRQTNKRTKKQKCAIEIAWYRGPRLQNAKGSVS